MPRQPAFQALFALAVALAATASASSSTPPHGSLTRIQTVKPDAAVVAVSPNGRNVYTAGGRSDRMHAYVRTATGTVRLLSGAAGCLARTDPHCRRGGAINGPTALVANGRAVFLTSWTGRQHVALYRRSAGTGALRLASCLGEGTELARCSAGGRATTGALALSPDGRFGYVTAREGPKKVTIFAIENGGRTLREVGCIGRNGSPQCASVRTRRFNPTALAVSPDGKNLYVASSTLADRGVVFAFARDRTTGLVTPLPSNSDCLAASVPGCRSLSPLSFHGASEGDPGGAIAISRNGRVLVVGGLPGTLFAQGIVIVLSRDPTTGALTAAACAGRSPGCMRAAGLSTVYAVAVAPDARTVYAGTAGGVVALRRTPQSLTEIGRSAIGSTHAVATTRDGSALYAAAGRLIVFRIHR